MPEPHLESIPPITDQPVGSPAHEVNGVLSERERQAEELIRSLPPWLVQSKEAFRRDLPRLLREHPRKWVAYTPDGQIGEPSDTAFELYRFCRERGLGEDEFYVFAVDPRSGEYIIDAEV